MALMTVRPTAVDVAVANEISSRTGPRTEEAAEALTWARMNISFARWRPAGGSIRATWAAKQDSQATMFS
jgi:hypothetical protein